VSAIGWRYTFVALGLPGILLALIVWFTVREPVRGGMDDPADLAALRASEDIPLLESGEAPLVEPDLPHHEFQRGPSALCGYGMNLWMPQFLVRIHELTPAQYSLPLGGRDRPGRWIGSNPWWCHHRQGCAARSARVPVYRR